MLPYQLKKLKECIDKGLLLETFIPGGIDAWIYAEPDDWYFDKDEAIKFKISCKKYYSTQSYTYVKLSIRGTKMHLYIQSSNGEIADEGYIKCSIEQYFFINKLDSIKHNIERNEI